MLKKLFTPLLLLCASTLHAQITDPMITNWWFNTNGNMYKGILTDVEAVYYNTQNVFIQTSGIPNYYQDGVTHNDAKDLDAVWAVPRTQSASPSPAGVMGGQIGLMLDGSVFFHPGDAQSYNNAGVWNRLAYFFEGTDMDASNGHSTPTNMYHHHFDNLKLHDFNTANHSPVVAYAWDGYPVYGPFGYANVDGTGGIKRIASSYGTKSYTTRTNGPDVNTQYPIGCFIEDWEYTAGSGDLDEHNGRFCKTPEYPNGTYAYFTTIDANQKPYYPYFIGPTFYGTFSNSNTGPNGGKTTIPTGTTKYTTTSVQDIEKLKANIEMFPVPVVDRLTIKLKENRNYIVTLYDLQGKVLTSKSLNATAQLDMQQYSQGVYFINIEDAQTKEGFIKRIVKQ